MAAEKTYFYSDGKSDYDRLKILNRLYNPTALQFLIEVGLQKDMIVLEYGCGMGFMAIEIAKYIGDNDKVIAIDISENSLDIAYKEARKSHIENIEFKLCNIEDIESLNTQFDFIYGRWVLAFCRNISAVLNKLYSNLAPRGIFVSEETNLEDNGHFSYPHEETITQWGKIGPKNSKKVGLELNLASKLYTLFGKAEFKCRSVKVNQPILITAEEKSVYRLGLEITRETTLKNKVLSSIEFEEMIRQLVRIENQDTIIGFYRNLLVSGKKEA